jgi:Domain of unknown function (DUF4211)
MPKRKQARVADSDDDFVVTTEESISEDEYGSPSEDISEESDSPPINPSPASAPSSSRRQSQRALASPVRQRKQAQLGALEKLKSARKARETRKRSAPAKAAKPQNVAEPLSEDSWSEKEKSVSPSPGKRARAREPATTVAARLRTKSSTKKPSQLLLGHRDYAERDFGGRGGGGSYTDDEDLANFIASDSGEEEEAEYSEDDDSSEDGVSADEEAKPRGANKKAGRGTAAKSKTKAAPKKKKAKVERKKKVKKEQHSSSEQEGEDEENKDDALDEDEGQQVASAERKKLNQLRPKLEVLIISSESEEDSEAVLAATTKAVGAGSVPSSQSPNKRRRLRKLAEEQEEEEEEVGLEGLKDDEDNLFELLSLPELEQKRKELSDALAHVTRDIERRKILKLDNAVVTDQEAAAVDNKTKPKSKSLRERPERPRLTAVQRIAQAQAAFKSQQNPDLLKEEENDSSGNEYSENGAATPSNNLSNEEEVYEEGGATGNNLSDDSEGSLRDLIVHDGEEELDAAGQQTTRTPVWQEAVESLRIGQRDDEECFYDYIEYLLMCYVDPTYKARINESPEHKVHFQYSVRRIETKMTTARDAVHSEAWRSCSRGLLEAVEWLPGAQSSWDPESVLVRDEEPCYWDDDSDSCHVKCAACNRRNSHATRKIIFKGRPRPPLDDETWEDLPANHRLSEKYLAGSPVYKKKRKRVNRGGEFVLPVSAAAGIAAGGIRQGGGRRGFQLGFRGQDDNEDDYNSDDSLSRFIRSRRSEQEQEENSSSDDEEEEGGRRHRRHGVAPKADLPFDAKQGPAGTYIQREFPVGRQCSVRLMLYHGMFHWKHRLLSRLKFELKEERRRRIRSNRPIDPGSVSDGVLSREPLKKALWRNFKELTEMGEAHQLAGGEIGNSAWRGGPAADPHRQVVAVLAALHDDSDGEESDVQWGEPEEGSGAGAGGGAASGEEDDDDDDDDDGGGASMGDRKRRRIAQMYRKKQQQRVPSGGEAQTPPSNNNNARRAAPNGINNNNKNRGGGQGRRDGRAQQVDIRNFFGSSPVKKEEEEVQKVGVIEDSQID